MNIRGTRFFVLLGMALILGAYQNCSPVNFSPSSSNGLVTPYGGGNGGGTTGQTLNSTHPVLAVRGLQCMACHGVVSGSNVVTDFGLGSSNFMSAENFFTSGRTAFNNTNTGVWGWQSLTVNGGSVYVPDSAISANVADIMFGINSATTLASVLQTPNLVGSSSPSMVVGVTPPAGQQPVIGVSSLSISYPSQSEILALVPQSLQSKSIAVSAINVSGYPASQMSGFVSSASGNYITNSSGTVQCYGDVVVKGALFLNNLSLQTDSNGCRLYVSQSVFIQGPITYTGASGSNLQITSSRAIIMGFSTLRLGAIQPGYSKSDSSTVRVASQGDNNLTTPGGNYTRFSVDLDGQYDPGNGAINGTARTAFFDNIVLDAELIGSQLLDAGDSAAVNNLVAGETTIQDGGSLPGPIVAINYTGLLLNAPHIHSRYGGNFQGVIIGDVAMLARNPSSSTTVEEFTYDPLYSTLQTILPALSTTILAIQP